MKESDLYGYTYDPKKPPGFQDPFTQRPGHAKSGGRELRQRRARDMLDSAAPSEEDEEDEEGRPSKRQRRATRKYDGSDAGTGTNTPKKHNGWGGARKKGVSKYSQTAASATPEPDLRGKRLKPSLVHHRIQEMREESAVTSSGDEGSTITNSMEDDEPPPPPPLPVSKRGGRGGSRGGKRGGWGNRGQRKISLEEDEPIPSPHAPNNPPPVLQSMSEGQNTFTLDAPLGSIPLPSTVGPHSSETVFQATPQPASAQDSTTGPSMNPQTPDAYITTTPLSQYGQYIDESSASGSRKKPRVKSEKRSQSMTIWWAERKAKQREENEKNGIPLKPSPSRTGSSSGRRGGRTNRPTPDHSPRTASFYLEGTQQHQPNMQEIQAPRQHSNPSTPFSAPSPNAAYAPISYAPPPPMLLQPSPLSAVPSIAPAPPPPPQSAPIVPGPGRTLAPAPLPPQPLHALHSYPSPFGPRSAPRPKSNGPPPLAPAPSMHVSPYPPLAPQGPPQSQAQGGASQRERHFKVMVPGPAPTEQERGR